MARRDEEARAEVAALLDAQAAAWNRGDLDAFCAVYAADAVFVSPSGLTRGRQAVLDRYRAKYPDAAAMGTLSLEVVETRIASGTEFSVLGDARPSRVHGVSVVARWRLAYPDREGASGLTLLVLRRARDGWVIVQDASM
jgi:ketosteroid isomerase-like protein